MPFQKQVIYIIKKKIYILFNIIMFDLLAGITFFPGLMMLVGLIVVGLIVVAGMIYGIYRYATNESYVDWQNLRRMSDGTVVVEPYADWQNIRRMSGGTVVVEPYADWQNLRRMPDGTVVAEPYADWEKLRRMPDGTVVGN
jgi:hypothetical protein